MYVDQNDLTTILLSHIVPIQTHNKPLLLKAEVGHIPQTQ